MRTLRSALPAGMALVLALTLAGCGGDAPPTTKPSVSPTSIGELDRQRERDGARVVRIAFCDLVPRAAVRRALAARLRTSQVWGNGDVVPGARHQVGHEFGCAWSGSGSRAARAWVFAQPVRASLAAALVRRAGRAPHCSATASTAFGRPSVVQTCRRGSGVTRVRRAGLFGDTWLTCELSGKDPRTTLRRRLDAWCVSVANALNATRLTG